jgi:deazaflavin-dependent oxidoreductase (nitroreductase family)
LRDPRGYADLRPVSPRENRVPNIRWLLALITAGHRFLYRISRGRLGNRIGGMRILLLTTLGRRTGQRRVTPLLYVEDKGRFVVVASNAGDDRDPAWWLNLKERPEAQLQVGSEHISVRARAAASDERPRLWTELDSAYRYYPEYRTRTERDIPIVILEPLA